MVSTVMMPFEPISLPLAQAGGVGLDRRGVEVIEWPHLGVAPEA